MRHSPINVGQERRETSMIAVATVHTSMTVKPLSVFFGLHILFHYIYRSKEYEEDKRLWKISLCMKSAEDGTADLKKTVKELAKSLADYEKKLEVYVGLVTCVRAKLLKCCNDFEQVYVCTDKISGNEDKCLEDQLRDAKGDEAVALEKKLDIIQKDENIEKGLKFLAYDEGRMESIQKEWMVEFSKRNPVKKFDRSKILCRNGPCQGARVQ
ncbi:hypothetical protein Tco_1036325 [Tanacetum coccineum]